MKKVRVVATAILLITVLSGCAGRVGAGGEPNLTATSIATDSATVGPTATSTNTPTPTPTPTPELTETTATEFPPPLDQLELSPEGLGYLRMGSPVPARPANEALVTWTDDFCAFGPSDPSFGWDTVYGPYATSAVPFSVVSQTEYSQVEYIFIHSKNIHTADGLRIGSSVADVEALGGRIEPSDAPEYEDAWVIHGSAGELVFWIANTEEGDITKGVVNWMQVQREDSKPLFLWEGLCE